MSQHAGDHSAPVDLGLHAHVLMPHVRRITEYKGQLDAGLVAVRRGRATPEQCGWLANEGFVKTDLHGTGVNPETFARWVLGPFRVEKLDDEHRQISVFPGWAAIGWNRRQYPKVDLCEAQTIKSSLDHQTLDPTVSDGYATWLKPLPVIIAGEGKHRVDLHRTHCLEMIARLKVNEFPPADELELVRIRGSTVAWGLRCLKKDNVAWNRGVRTTLAYLPLPNLSIPFFEAYGVQVSARRAWPWQVYLGIDEASLCLKLRPAEWRNVVLSSGYI